MSLTCQICFSSSLAQKSKDDKSKCASKRHDKGSEIRRTSLKIIYIFYELVFSFPKSADSSFFSYRETCLLINYAQPPCVYRHVHVFVCVPRSVRARSCWHRLSCGLPLNRKRWHESKGKVQERWWEEDGGKSKWDAAVPLKLQDAANLPVLCKWSAMRGWVKCLQSWLNGEKSKSGRCGFTKRCTIFD